MTVRAKPKTPTGPRTPAKRAGVALRLIAEHIACERGGRRLFEDLSFSLAGGEALLLSGPNGAGKTSLLRLIAGLLPPTAGAIRLSGSGDGESVGEHCHFIGHANATKNALSVRENLSFWASYLGGSTANVVPALSAMGLEALSAIPAGLLSAGQKRRLALARLRAAERRLWLLDEPTVSLDAEGVDRLLRLVEAHLASGGLAVIASHLPLGLRFVQEIRLAGKRQ